MHVLGNVRLRRLARGAARLRRPLAAVAVVITVAAAIVTTGSSATPATAAAALPMPTVDERVTSTVQDADGTWTVTYDIAVTNPDGTRATEYDLSDTLEFGDGLTISTAKVTGPPRIAVNPDWTGADDTGIVANRTIAADGVEHYTVTVTGTPTGTPTAAASDTDRDCALTNEERGTGFRNRASVLVGSRIATSTACAVASALAISGRPIGGTTPTGSPVPSSNPGGGLAYTGVPLGDLVPVGIGILIIGVGLLLLIGRRRKDSRPVR